MIHVPESGVCVWSFPWNFLQLCVNNCDIVKQILGAITDMFFAVWSIEDIGSQQCNAMPVPDIEERTCHKTSVSCSSSVKRHSYVWFCSESLNIGIP